MASYESDRRKCVFLRSKKIIVRRKEKREKRIRKEKRERKWAELVSPFFFKMGKMESKRDM